MKSLILIASTIILFCFSSSAQTEKGNYLLGASNLFEFSNINTLAQFPDYHNKKEYIELSFSPILGYFLIDNLSIGVIPSFYFHKENIDQSQTHLSTRNFSISAFSRYYLGEKKFKPFAHFGMGYINKHQKNEFDFQDEGIYVWKGGSIVYDFGIGLSYFITRNLSLDLFTVYSISTVDMNLEGGAPNENFSYEAKEFAINLSLVFYFGKSNQSSSDQD